MNGFDGDGRAAAAAGAGPRAALAGRPRGDQAACRALRRPVFISCPGIPTQVMPRGVVRFAVGRPDGPRSGAWRVWTERDGSLYIAARRIANSFKASLHPVGWRIAFSAQHADSAQSLVPRGTDRAVRKFDRPAELAPGVTRAFSVLIPAAAALVPAYGGSERGDIVWLPTPPADHVTEVSIILTNPNTRTTGWPGKRGMGTSLVGRLHLANGESAWVVYRERPEEAGERDTWVGWRHRVRDLVSGSPALRDSDPFELVGVALGEGPDGSWFFAELPLALGSRELQGGGEAQSAGLDSP